MTRNEQLLRNGAARAFDVGDDALGEAALEGADALALVESAKGAEALPLVADDWAPGILRLNATVTEITDRMAREKMAARLMATAIALRGGK